MDVGRLLRYGALAWDVVHDQVDASSLVHELDAPCEKNTSSSLHRVLLKHIAPFESTISLF